eukprot:4471504-Amphidinium_carterae.1
MGCMLRTGVAHSWLDTASVDLVAAERWTHKLVGIADFPFCTPTLCCCFLDSALWLTTPGAGMRWPCLV